MLEAVAVVVTLCSSKAHPELCHGLQELEQYKHKLACEQASSQGLKQDLGSERQQVASLKQQLERAAAQAQQEQAAAKQALQAALAQQLQEQQALLAQQEGAQRERLRQLEADGAAAVNALQQQMAEAEARWGSVLAQEELHMDAIVAGFMCHAEHACV